MNYSASRVFEKYSDMTVRKSPSYIVHDGSAKGFVGAMRGAYEVISSKKLLYFLTAFGSALGITAITTLSILKGYSLLSANACIGFLCIWNIFVYILTKLRKIVF